MAEYIEREALLNKLQERDLCLCVTERDIKDAPAADVVSAVVYRLVEWERDLALKQLRCDYGVGLGEKKADVAQVVHGRWVIVDDGVMIGDGKHMECGVCHTWSKDRIKTNYCPNCGARMDLEVGT